MVYKEFSVCEDDLNLLHVLYDEMYSEELTDSDISSFVFAIVRRYAFDNFSNLDAVVKLKEEEEEFVRRIWDGR